MPIISDDEWVVQITDQKMRMTHAAPDFCTPRTLGELDAHDGKPATPRAYYTQARDIAEYMAGYTAERIHMEDAEDYANDIEDRLFWARGGW